MPVISYFFGIYVRMYHSDHPPAHIHIEYQGHEALVDIDSGVVTDGALPRRAARLVQEWVLEHPVELRANWEKARRLEPLDRIAGADND